MTRNIGDVDRTVRLLGGATLSFVFAHGAVRGGEILLGVVTIFLLGTVVLGWCPFYAAMRVSTRRPHDAPGKS